MSNTIRIRAKRVTTLPRELCPGPGNTNLRMEVGGETALDPARAARFSRHLNILKADGDIEFLDGPGDVIGPAPQPIASSPATAPGAAPPTFTLGGTTRAIGDQS